MKNNKLYLALLLALILAGSATFLVTRKLNQAGVKQPTSSIVVASKDLDIGAPLTADVLKLIEWSGSVPKGAFTDVAAVSGRAVLYPMFTNEAVLDAKLAPVGAGAGLPAVIPSGMRAVSIRVDEVVAVAGFVGPGTRVDVLLTGQSGSQSTGESLTKTILENIQVLAAGQKIQPDAQGRAETVNVVTLLCSSQDAAKVTLAAHDGRIQLLLRNPTDSEDDKEMVSIGRASLFAGAAVPTVAKAAEPRRRTVTKPVISSPTPVLVATAAPPPAPEVVAPKEPEKATIVVIRGDRVSSVQVLERERK